MERIPEALTLSVQAFIDMKEGSKALMVGTQVSFSWIATPDPMRRRDSQFNPNQLEEGKNFFLRGSERYVTARTHIPCFRKLWKSPPTILIFFRI